MSEHVNRYSPSLHPPMQCKYEAVGHVFSLSAHSYRHARYMFTSRLPLSLLFWNAVALSWQHKWLVFFVQLWQELFQLKKSDTVPASPLAPRLLFFSFPGFHVTWMRRIYTGWTFCAQLLNWQLFLLPWEGFQRFGRGAFCLSPPRTMLLFRLPSEVQNCSVFDPW